MKRILRLFLPVLILGNIGPGVFAFGLDDLGNAVGVPTDAKSLALGAAQKLFTPQVLGQYPEDPLEDQAVNAYAKKILARLQPYAINKDFTLQVFKTAKINGFSGATHEIDITRGLLNMTHNEAELACVIGHEIGHADLNHADKVYQESYMDSAQSKGIVLIGQLSGQSDTASAADYARSNMTIANFGQKLEQDADEYGAVLAAKAGYDPYAFVDLFNRLAQKRGTDLGVHLNALTEGHKSSDVRAQHLFEFLQAKGYKPGHGFRGTQPFQTAMADLQAIRTGDGGDQPPAPLSGDEKKDAAEITDLCGQMKQAVDSGTKITPAQLAQTLNRFSAYFQKYHVTREAILEAAADEAVEKLSAPKGSKSFMDDNLGQDQPYPWYQNLGPAGKFAVDGLEYAFKVGLTGLATFIPEVELVNIGIGAYESAEGRDLFTGEPLSNADRVLSGIGAMAGAGSLGSNLSGLMDGLSEGEQLTGNALQNYSDVAQAIHDSTEFEAKSLGDLANWANADNPLPTYQAGQDVYQGSTPGDETFYRVLTPSSDGGGGAGAADPDVEGNDLVNFDPSQYTPAQLQQGLSLPSAPTGYAKVTLPAKTGFVVGKIGQANAQKGGMLKWTVVGNWRNAGMRFSPFIHF